jgi:pyruvate,water dikinase
MDSHPLVLPLGAPDVPVEVAGGKGATLSRLIHAGFPVPPGFVLTIAAYQAFVHTNDLSAQIVELSGTASIADPESFEAAAQAIRSRFEQGRMPPDVAGAVRQAYGMLPVNSAVAVRSSATAEDLPEASFAGQQETYLNVRGEPALLQAVQRCWSSLWTARAMAYRARRQMAPDRVALAVVVQQMVPAQAAGVLFTVNPVSGAADEVLINATWGLGEALVAGQVNPDTLTVEKATGRIKRVQFGDKAIMTAATDVPAKPSGCTLAGAKRRSWSSRCSPVPCTRAALRRAAVLPCSVAGAKPRRPTSSVGSIRCAARSFAGSSSASSASSGCGTTDSITW